MRVPHAGGALRLQEPVDAARGVGRGAAEGVARRMVRARPVRPQWLPAVGARGARPAAGRPPARSAAAPVAACSPRIA
eukprot:6946655-Prymnesium_polylepis.2